MKFKGKISWYLLLIFAAGEAASLSGIWDFFQSGAGKAGIGALIFGFVLYNGIVVPILIRNYVEITDTRVVVYFGFLKESMELSEIREVYQTHNPIASTAASLDRLEIVGRRQSIICAVKEKDAFLLELRKRICV